MAHQPLVTDDEIIGQVIHSLEHYALGDIKKTSEQGLIVAAFMLAACFIDQLAHQRYFKLISGTSEKFIAFVNAYFDGKYDGKSLCLDLRSRLVHNYSVTQSYALTKGRPDWHLITDEQGITCLNIDAFIAEIEEAFKKLKAEMYSCQEVRSSVLGHYSKYEVIRQKQ